MTHPRPVALIAWLTCLAALAAPSAAQPMIDRVPAEAVVYIGWRGADDLGAGYEGSRLRGVLTVVELEETFAQLSAAIRAVDEEQPEVPEQIAALRPLAESAWRHPTAVYLAPPAEGDAGGEPLLVLMCEAGDDAAAVTDALTRAIADTGGAEARAVEADGVVYLVVGGAPGDGPPPVPAKPLTASQRYAATVAHVDADAAVLAYFDVAGMLGWAEQMVAADTAPAAMGGGPVRAATTEPPAAAAVELPTVPAADDPPQIVVNVRADGTIVYGGKVVSVDELVDALAPVAAVDDQPGVAIRADRDAEFAVVSGVLARLTEAGLSNIAMATTEAAAEPPAAGAVEGGMRGPGGGRPDAAEARQMITALGIDAVDAVAVSAGFLERDWQTRAFVGVAAPRRGLATLFDDPFDPALLRLVPVDAPAASLARFDLKEVLTEVRRVAAVIDPQSGEQQLEDALAQASEMLGADVETQLINALGPDWVMYTDVAATGGGLPGLVIANKLRDPEAADAALQQLGGVLTRLAAKEMDDTPGSVRIVSTDHDGLTVHSLTAVFITPSWAIHDGVLYAALLPQPLLAARDHAQRLKQRDARPKTILDNPAFVALSKRLGEPGAKPVSFSFVDIPNAIDGAYGTSLMLTQMINSGAALFGGDTMPMLLPPLHRLKPHLAPAGSVMWADGAGLHAQSIEPFPMAAALANPMSGGSALTVAPVAAGVLLPALGNAKKAAMRAKAQANARGLVHAYSIYMTENKDRPPTEPGAVVASDYATLDLYHSPFVKSSPVLQVNGGVAAQTDFLRNSSHYIAMPDIDSDFDATKVFVFLDPDFNGGDSGTAVGYGDGHVKWIETDELRRQVKRQTGKTLEQVVAEFRGPRPAAGGFAEPPRAPN